MSDNNNNSISMDTPANPEIVFPVFEQVIVEPSVIRNGHKPKAIGDLNGDGQNDILIYSRGQGLFWYEYPNWTKHKMSERGNGEQAQIVDIDGDGDADVVIGGIRMSVRWYENPLNQGQDPATTLWQERIIGSAASHDLEIGDINRDGKIDIATQDGVFLQETPTSWRAIANDQFPDRAGEGTTFGDLLGDGYLDLLDSSAGQLVWYENPLHTGGDPVSDVWTRHVISAGFEENSIGVADVNGDGRQDVLLANSYGLGGLTWYEAPVDRRNGAWIAHEIDPTANYVHQSSIMVGDFNRDELLDVAITEQEQSLTRRIAIYYNQGGGLAWSQQVLGITGGHNPKMGDIDNDGDLDILNANHGYLGAANPVELWRNMLIPSPTFKLSF